MTHLDESQIGDAIDGRVEAAAASHLESCPRCQSQVAQLRTVLQQAAAIEMPEPSPLFWDQFRGRIRRALDEPEAASSGWAFGLGFRWLSAVSVALTVALVALTFSLGPRPSRVTDAAAPAGEAALVASDVDDVDQDEAWALVRNLADDLDYDAAHDAGVAPAPGSVERAAVELSPTEQTALIELLERELKRTDS